MDSHVCHISTQNQPPEGSSLSTACPHDTPALLVVLVPATTACELLINAFHTPYHTRYISL